MAIRFNDFAGNAKNYDGNENNMEYFEDSHRSQFGGTMPSYSQTPTMKQTAQSGLFMSTPYCQNVVVYEPRSPEDVQTLIDYLKQREPAVVNLDNVEPQAAQRILDFVSGATYALSGSVHRIASNIFLLSPEGVGITVPYESKP